MKTDKCEKHDWYNSDASGDNYEPCPYCQLAATQAEYKSMGESLVSMHERAEAAEKELEEAKESATIWEDRYRKRGYVMEEHAQALKERDELREELEQEKTRHANAIVERDYFQELYERYKKASNAYYADREKAEAENQSLRTECERLKEESSSLAQRLWNANDAWIRCTGANYPKHAEVIISKLESELATLRRDTKRTAVQFFYWWHNQSGSNTEQGFDEFIAREVLKND